MPRFKLNPIIPGNYSFHCPDARITLNVYRPVATFKEVTPAIVRGVTMNRIIDLDGAVEVKHHHIEAIQPTREGKSNGVQEKENIKKEEVTAKPEVTEVQPLTEEVAEAAAEEMVAEEEQPVEPKPKTTKKRSGSTKK